MCLASSRPERESVVMKLFHAHHFPPPVAPDVAWQPAVSTLCGVLQGVCGSVLESTENVGRGGGGGLVNTMQRVHISNRNK